MTTLHIVEFKPSSEPAGFEVHYMNTLVGYFVAVEGHEGTYFLYDSQLCTFAVEAASPEGYDLTDESSDLPAVFARTDFFRITANLVSAGILR